MIFVTLGTQKQGFDRLLKEIDESKVLRGEQIIAQVGYTKYEPTRNDITVVPFMTDAEMENYIDQSEFVISHGGVGSIFKSLRRGKKVLAVPRLSKFGEHVNDHQVEICKKLYSMGHIGYYNKLDTRNEEIPDTLDSKINFLRSSTLVPYVENTEYLGRIKNAIDELLK